MYYVHVLGLCFMFVFNYTCWLPGQKCCLHVHNVFPYFYVVSPTTNVSEKFLDQLSSSLNQALNLSLIKSGSNSDQNSSQKRRYVYKIEPLYAM